MGCRALWMWMAGLAVVLSGCSSPDEGESDGGVDTGRSDRDAAAVDAKRDSRPADDGGRDGRAVTDATLDAEPDRAMAADAAADAGSDGTLATDSAFEAAADGSALPDATRDAAGDGAVFTDATTGCINSDAGLSGVAVPAGTTATASGSDSAQTPSGLIDGTGWNAGASTGWIELTFPAPFTLNGIQFNAGAAPTATETYTVTGFQGSAEVPLGSWTDMVEGNCGCSEDLPPMLFAEAAYDAIRIDVQGGASWVAINAISFLTDRCPAPVDSGTFGIDSGAPDTGAEDSAEDSPEAGACTLSAVAATPFPALSGSANVTGTDGTPTGAVSGSCIALVTSATSGALTFAMQSTGCSLSYLNPSGTALTSTLAVPTTFDGDTYTCTYTQTGYSAGGQLGVACPELNGERNGLSAYVSLAVTRSTGAITLSRQCIDTGMGICPGGSFSIDNGTLTNELELGGSLSCGDAGSGG